VGRIPTNNPVPNYHSSRSQSSSLRHSDTEARALRAAFDLLMLEVSADGVQV
jgi:hypothetical protein